MRLYCFFITFGLVTFFKLKRVNFIDRQQLFFAYCRQLLVNLGKTVALQPSSFMLDQYTWQSLIYSPHSITAEQRQALQAMIDEYPYFQVPFLLMAVSSKDSVAIRAAAVRSSERKVLMQFINAQFDQNISLPNLNDIDLDAGNTNAFEALENSDQPEASALFSDPDYSTQVYQQEYTPAYLQEDPTETDNFWDRYREAPTPSPIEEITSEQTVTAREQEPATTEEETRNEMAPETEVPSEQPPYRAIQYEEQGINHTTPVNYDEVNQDVDTESDSFIKDMMQTLKDMQKARDVFMNEGYTVVDIEKDASGNPDFSAQPHQGTDDPASNSPTVTPLATNTAISYFDIFEKEAAVLENRTNPSDSNLFELNNILEDLNSSYSDQRLVKEIVVATYQKKIIDQVIENNPFNKIRNSPQVETDTSTSIAMEMYENSVTENPKTATENLARLHILQGNYQKAMMIYKQLALKYPEKSHYFADRIKELENKL